MLATLPGLPHLHTLALASSSSQYLPSFRDLERCRALQVRCRQVHFAQGLRMHRVHRQPKRGGASMLVLKGNGIHGGTRRPVTLWRHCPRLVCCLDAEAIDQTTPHLLSYGALGLSAP